MITVIRYSVDKKQLWDDFIVDAKNSTFLFIRNYLDYHSDRFLDHSLMFYYDGVLIAVLPASQHGNELQSHGGLTYGGLIMSVSCTVQLVIDIFTSLKTYCLENEIKSLLYKRVPYIYHKYPSDEDLYALFRLDANLIRRDIASTIFIPSMIRFSERRRRGCKRASKSGLIVKQSYDYENYISILCDVLEKYHNSKPVHTSNELKMLAECFPKNIKLYSAFKDDVMLAGVVVYETETVAHAQYIANSDIGRKCGALDCVMDYLIHQIYKDKIFFDFGISTEDNGRYLNNGLITQKQEFGGRGVAYDFYKICIWK